MRVKARFVFHMAHEEADAFFARINMPMKDRKINDTLHVVEVYKETQQYITVAQALVDFGVKCTPKESIEFSKTEIEAAPLLQMIPKHHRGGYPQPEMGKKATNYQSVSFDLNTGCPYCTKGRIQNNPLHLRSDTKLGTADISGVWWMQEFIVSRRLREIVEQTDLKGCEFWPVVKHKTGKFFEDVFQLKIVTELPPMAKETDFSENSIFLGQPICPNGCGEKVIKSLVYYRSNVLEDLPDFSLSNEWIGARSNYWRLPFVSQKTYRLFQRHKIKGVWFEPAIVLP